MDLIGVGILLIGLLVLLGDLLGNQETPDITDTAEVKGSLALVVADIRICTVSKKDLHTLSRASPSGLVKCSLTRLVLNMRVGTVAEKKLAGGRIARSTSPVKSSLTQTVQLVNIDILGLIIEVLLDKVILTGLSGSDETRGLSDLWTTSGGCHSF